MENHFNQPQRQSPIGVLVMFLDTMRQYAKALGPLFVIGILRFSEINKLYLFLGVAAVVLLIAVIAYLRYINFTFYLDDENEEFIINEGVFNKSKTTIQLSKIQKEL